MQFVIHNSGDIPRHAQRLLMEHQRLLRAGGKGAAHLYHALGDAAAKTRHLETMAPRDVARTLFHYSRAKVVHAGLFERLVSLAARRAADFRPGEMHDLFKSIKHLQWRPSAVKVDMLAAQVIKRPQVYSLPQAAELLYCVAELRHEPKRFFKTLGDHVVKLDALVGWQMTPEDASKLLRAHAMQRVANHKVMGLVAYRVTRPGRIEDVTLKQMGHMLWAMANLQHRGQEFYDIAAGRLHELTERERGRGVTSKVAAPLMWAVASLGMSAHLVTGIAACASLDDTNHWRATIMLWAYSHARISLDDAAASTFVAALCDSVRVDAARLSPDEMASVTWSLASMQHRDEALFRTLLDNLRRSNWDSLNQVSKRSVVDLACAYAEAGIPCDELLVRAAEVLDGASVPPTTMTRFGWSLVTADDPSAAKAFRTVSLWARRVDLHAVAVGDLSNLLWAAASLSVDKKLQTHLGELISMKTAEAPMPPAADPKPGGGPASPPPLPHDVLSG